jgi:hypothetical protein
MQHDAIGPLFRKRHTSDLLTSGYSPLINIQPIAGMAVWDSNAVVAAGTQTLTWSNPLVNATTCADGSSGGNICSAVMALVAVQSRP